MKLKNSKKRRDELQSGNWNDEAFHEQPPFRGFSSNEIAVDVAPMTEDWSPQWENVDVLETAESIDGTLIKRLFDFREDYDRGPCGCDVAKRRRRCD